ncbi:MAG: Iojap protein [uncultured Campylobacterales bacterium]|uniref:Iojap protein n=1 Tax=uncultured Campylobacterales bacterium TaxID=352960 RepID=A0A6S6S894_9BACT|nr:MAG: Iojap protein [uncultured Campylobacterales bacterium]
MIEKRIDKLKEILTDKNANQVEAFNMVDTDYFVDAVVVASSLGGRHSSALLKEIKEKSNEEFVRVDESDDWIVADLGDILVHIMNEEARELYRIEDFLSTYNEKFGTVT